MSTVDPLEHTIADDMAAGRSFPSITAEGRPQCLDGAVSPVLDIEDYWLAVAMYWIEQAQEWRRRFGSAAADQVEECLDDASEAEAKASSIRRRLRTVDDKQAKEGEGCQDLSKRPTL